MKINFNSNVGVCMGKKSYTTQRVGLELEYERATDSLSTTPEHWNTVNDYSLRTGGIEFVSSPLLKSAISSAVVNMIAAAKSIGCKVTKRCGMHVHVNVTQLSWKELFNFLTYYTLLEPYLFKTVAGDRDQSHFCVPTWTNVSLAETMYTDCVSLRNGILFPEEVRTRGIFSLNSRFRHKLHMNRTPKYAALNLNSLSKFGTVEFRQAESSLDPEFITGWANTLLNIQTQAIKYKDPTDIVKEYDKAGLALMCERVGIEYKGLVDTMNQEDAVDTATIIAGYIPVEWKKLQWEVQ